MRIAPKLSRVENVVAEVSGVLLKGSLRGYEASGLAQRIRFLRETHFGKCGARVLHGLAEHSKAAGSVAETTPRLRKGLEWLVSYLPAAPARQLQAWSNEAPVLVFTDGANEPEAVTVGAVLLERGAPPEYFGARVPDELVKKWQQAGGHQVIGQAELLPVQVAARVWQTRIAGILSIWFLDQDAARRGMIRGYSPAARSSDIIEEAVVILAAVETFPWYRRRALEARVCDVGSDPGVQKMQY